MISTDLRQLGQMQDPFSRAAAQNRQELGKMRFMSSGMYIFDEIEYIIPVMRHIPAGKNHLRTI
jgi:hypothetical protein